MLLVLHIQKRQGGLPTPPARRRRRLLRQAISRPLCLGPSLLTFAAVFSHKYAIALAPAAAGTAACGSWPTPQQSMVYLGALTSRRLNNPAPIPSASRPPSSHVPGVRSTIQVFGTYVRTDRFPLRRPIAANLTGAQGWIPSPKRLCQLHFDAGAALIKLPLAFGISAPGTRLPGAMPHGVVDQAPK